MCGTCGCGEDHDVVIRKPGDEPLHHTHHHHHEGHEHTHEHEHGRVHNHDHPHAHDHSHGTTLTLEKDILLKNNLTAERNRGYFEAKGITAINLVSSPGSGKTTILEKTIRDLGDQLPLSIIEGDQQTMNDADRIHAAGAPVVQVNTGNGCHLDSEMINRAVKQLEPRENSILFIENVGNLVCPSMFDLGESYRVVIISVTEGEDKPLKYPNMFESSDICLINKTDLLPYVDFSIDKTKEYALRVNHHLKFFELSARNGEGLAEWYQWLKNIAGRK